ncbi:MAG: hypothetical protein RR256_07660, partial [Bacteroidales bacterium]
HEACDQLRDAMNGDFADRVQLSVHSDPCNGLHCEHCLISDCKVRQHPFAALEEFTLTEMTQSDEERGEHATEPNFL